MVRPRKKPIGNAITVAMLPIIRGHLEEISKKNNQSISETITHLIETEYNLENGGSEAGVVIEKFWFALVTLAKSRNVNVEHLVKISDALEKIKKELPEIEEAKKREMAKLKAIDKQIMDLNKKRWQEEDKNK